MTKHPAKYTDCLLPHFVELLSPDVSITVLDPFAGTGKIHLLPYKTVGLEIEPEWASMHQDTICGDATNMPFEADTFDAIVTSPTYGNRMADNHNAKDGSKRMTYTHVLGRQLNENNSGKMHFGQKYKELHQKAYLECKRVLKKNGVFILNVKNFIKNNNEVDVHSWHCETLKDIGFLLLETRKVDVKGNGFGANREKRINFEYITKFQNIKALQDNK